MRATWQSVLAICADESSASDRRMRVRSDWSSARHASDWPSTARSYEIDCVATMGSGATGASARTSSRRSPARLRPPFVAQNTRARPTKGSSPCTRLRSIRDPQRLVPAARQRFRLTESVPKDAAGSGGAVAIGPVGVSPANTDAPKRSRLSGRAVRPWRAADVRRIPVRNWGEKAGCGVPSAN